MARNMKELHPRLQAAITKLKAQFPDIGIGECFRTVSEQDALYAKGRTAPGRIVTNAKGSAYGSQHQWGIAVDFFYNKRGQEYSDAGYFKKVGAYAKSIGLGWGGDWKNPVDIPHLYLPDWGATTAQLKRQYGTFAAFQKTWGSGWTAGAEKKTEEKTGGKMKVDGSWGAETTRAAQRIFGTKQDGIVSCQPTANRKYLTGAYEGSWQFTSGAQGGSALICEIQKQIGVTADGWFGKQSVIALQQFLNRNGYAAGAEDGIMGAGTVRAWQTYLNTK